MSNKIFSYQPRGGGKTRDALREVAAKNGYFLCLTRGDADRLQKKAKLMGLTIKAIVAGDEIQGLSFYDS